MEPWMFWVGALALGLIFQVLKRLFGDNDQRRQQQPRRESEPQSYRPPSEDLERLREESLPPTRSNPPVRRERQFQSRQTTDRPEPALAGDPATEGSRVIMLPEVQVAPERPSTASIPSEALASGAESRQTASSVAQRRLTLASHRQTNPLRTTLLRSLRSREGIRQAFVLQAVLGQPKGLLSDDQSVERP